MHADGRESIAEEAPRCSRGPSGKPLRAGPSKDLKDKVVFPMWSRWVGEGGGKGWSLPGGINL